MSDMQSAEFFQTSLIRQNLCGEQDSLLNAPSASEVLGSIDETRFFFDGPTENWVYPVRTDEYLSRS
jgi:hypothetical protein